MYNVSDHDFFHNSAYLGYDRSFSFHGINRCTGFTHIIRIVLEAPSFYGILLTTPSGGINDRDARRCAAYLSGGGEEIGSHTRHSKAIHCSEGTTRGQGGRTLEGQTECARPIYYQEQHNRRKITGLRQHKNSVASSHSHTVVQTVEYEPFTRYLYAYFSQYFWYWQGTYAPKMSEGGGRRVFAHV